VATSLVDVLGCRKPLCQCLRLQVAQQAFALVWPKGKGGKTVSPTAGHFAG
jgi:hypothetical protein